MAYSIILLSVLIAYCLFWLWGIMKVLEESRRHMEERSAQTEDRFAKGELFEIDWDGPTTVSVIERGANTLTIARVDGDGNILLDQMNVWPNLTDVEFATWIADTRNARKKNERNVKRHRKNHDRGVQVRARQEE